MAQNIIPIQGTCHCGNIRFELQWPGADPDIVMRCCNCKFCQKHGGAWTSHRESTLTVYLRDLARVSKYRFGTATADFYVCSTCGVVPLVISEIDNVAYGVVNVNSFEDRERLQLSSTTTNFDGEGMGDRLERRQRNWIPFVKFSS